MLNANKIRWMTRASIYEKEEGITDLNRNTFFASDYVRYNVLKNFMCVSLAAIMIAALYCLCKIEYIMTLVAEMNFAPLVTRMLTIYIITIVVYSLLGVAVYTWQYQASKDRVKKYYRMLKLIEKYGQGETK